MGEGDMSGPSSSARVDRPTERADADTDAEAVPGRPATPSSRGMGRWRRLEPLALPGRDPGGDADEPASAPDVRRIADARASGAWLVAGGARKAETGMMVSSLSRVALVRGVRTAGVAAYRSPPGLTGDDGAISPGSLTSEPGYTRSPRTGVGTALLSRSRGMRADSPLSVEAGEMGDAAGSPATPR